MNYKTDWKSTDRFNLSDYNDINTKIQALADRMINNYTLVPTITLKTNYTISDVWSAETINKVVNSIDSLAEITHPSGYIPNYPVSVSTGGKAWSYKDVNQMENNLKVIEEQISLREKEDNYRLKFTLNGGDF